MEFLTMLDVEFCGANTQKINSKELECLWSMLDEKQTQRSDMSYSCLQKGNVSGMAVHNAEAYGIEIAKSVIAEWLEKIQCEINKEL